MPVGSGKGPQDETRLSMAIKRKAELTPQQKARVLRAAENVMSSKCKRVEIHKRGDGMEVREVVRELTHRV